MVSWIYAILKGLLIGYWLAGPRKDPEFEAWLAMTMGLWRITWSVVKLGQTAEKASIAFSEASGVIFIHYPMEEENGALEAQ